MHTKALFVDRDGTLIYEPEDESIDTLEKLEFIPGVFRNLYYIQHVLGYKLIMVSNQDGLGTPEYPRENFEMVQDKIITAFANEGIYFDEIEIDPSKAEDNSPNRKPRTGMVEKYLTQPWDWDKSFVIGDRSSDIELARNMNIRGIFIGSDETQIQPEDLRSSSALVATHWDEIFYFLRNVEKTAHVKRKTKETDIDVGLSALGRGDVRIDTGLEFFNHILEQLARHASFDLNLQVNGDLEVDEHHTIEDTALALGEACNKALANKTGMQRFGFNLPMDDSIARVAIDFGGRPWLVWDAEFSREKVGDVPTEMFMHFFKSFADNARCNVNIEAKGDNAHHKVEAIFKAVGNAIKMALKQDIMDNSVPSTKGTL